MSFDEKRNIFVFMLYTKMPLAMLPTYIYCGTKIKKDLHQEMNASFLCYTDRYTIVITKKVTFFLFLWNKTFSIPFSILKWKLCVGYPRFLGNIVIEKWYKLPCGLYAKYNILRIVILPVCQISAINQNIHLIWYMQLDFLPSQLSLK